MARILDPTADSIAQAAAAIRAGRTVVLPTETVYGLGADATDDRAVAAIFAAKERPRFNPLIVHVPDAAAAQRHVQWTSLAEKLAAAFWPGPLTLVLQRRPDCRLSLLVSAGLDTAAIRVPRHPLAQSLLRAADRPIAAPSANRSGSISPTRPEHVVQSLGDAVDIVLDGGPCLIGLESTVIDARREVPVVLRPGGITREDIVRIAGAVQDGGMGGPKHSPGMLESHYAPSLPLRLNATEVNELEGLIAFGPMPLQGAGLTINLSFTGNLAEAAAGLFATMRTLDRPGLERIAVMPIPDTGLGEAINDRLKRAAAAR
ncbi:MAG: translation factor Sua5 [Alphaproteobacteria bacterium]|nr:translation factor Sua5 [Alphaproteobacteria bacterium]